MNISLLMRVLVSAGAGQDRLCTWLHKWTVGSVTSGAIFDVRQGFGYVAPSTRLWRARLPRQQYCCRLVEPTCCLCHGCRHHLLAVERWPAATWELNFLPGEMTVVSVEVNKHAHDLTSPSLAPMQRHLRSTSVTLARTRASAIPQQLSSLPSI
jgi:hypothetical protein